MKYETCYDIDIFEKVILLLYNRNIDELPITKWFNEWELKLSDDITLRLIIDILHYTRGDRPPYPIEIEKPINTPIETIVNLLEELLIKTS